MEILKHECGIAMIRLLKPLEYYKRKYGTSYYALDKLYLMMEKQHNRGQDGAGIACVKLNQEPGDAIWRFRTRTTRMQIPPLTESSIWVTSATLQQARAGSNMCIHF